MDQFRLMFTGVPFAIDHPVFHYLREEHVSFEYAKHADSAVESFFIFPVDVLVMGIAEFKTHQARLSQYKQQYPASTILVYFDSIDVLVPLDQTCAEGILFGPSLIPQLSLFLKEHLFIKKLMELMRTQQSTLDEQRQIMDALNTRVEKMVEDAEGDFSVINSIQSSLMPRRFPDSKQVSFQGYFSAGAKSGGDFFDVFSLNRPHSIGLLQLDSVGHTITSALLTALMKIAVGAELTAAPSPLEGLLVSVMHKIGGLLGSGERAIRLRVGWLDTKKLQCEWASFGFSPAYYYSASQQSLTSIGEGSNPPFHGTESTNRIQRHAMKLLPGDVLFFPTDGCEPALSEMKSSLEKNASVPLVELRNQLAFHLKDERQPLTDDASFLLLQTAPHLLQLVE